MRRLGTPVLVSVGLVVLAVSAYAPVWHNEFINLDDVDGIVDNPHVREGLTAANLHWAWTTFRQGNWIPLNWMSLQLDASLGPPDVPSPAIFHSQNLLWHAATSVLLFLALRRLTGSVWCSALVAALFAVHPLHVESVAWATERKDVLSTFFLALTLLAYSSYVECPSPQRYVLVAVAFALGLLAKPMLVTLPCVLLLLDFWPLHRWGWPAEAKAPAAGGKGKGSVTADLPTTPRRGLGWVVLEKVPLLLIACAACAVAVRAQRYSDAVRSVQVLPLSARLANAVESCGWYLEKTFWPTGLAVFYPHPGSGWAVGPLLVWGPALVAITGLAVSLRRQCPYLLVGWLWFLGTLVPVIGLVQVGAQARADRYTYVPHIGLFIALVWATADGLDRLRVPALARAAAAVACLVPLALLTWVQVGYWHDTVTIWGHALDIDPANRKAAQNLAGVLFNQANELATRGLAESDPDLLAAAAERYRRAVVLEPGRVDYHFNFGLLLLDRGDGNGAAQEMRAAGRLQPGDMRAWYNVGLALRMTGRTTDAEGAFRHVLHYNPEVASARAQLGTVLWQQGRRQPAAAAWEAALRQSPGEPEALAGTGQALLREGRNDEAARRLAASVATSPLPERVSLVGVALGRLGRWPEAVAAHRDAVDKEQRRWRVLVQPDRPALALYRRRLAYALQAAGQSDASAKEYTASRELEPGWPGEAVKQAWRLATEPGPEARDPAEARELAEQVCQALPEPPPEALDVMAAALAACGRFPEAAAAARKALAKAPPDLADAMAARLKLYEQKRPFVAQKRQIP
jgi:tetratricopeptide (TPR) repeat protein